MLLLAVVVLVWVPLLGGDLRRLPALRLRTTGVLPAAAVLQVLGLGVLADVGGPLPVALHALSYVLAAVFVWRNRALPGLWLLALGAALNALTIALNGGTLPASATALERAGRATEADGFVNSGVLPDAVLPWLGDVFWVPAWFPFANVFSVGDVLVLAGLAWTVHAACRGTSSLRMVHAVQDPLLELDLADLRAEVDRAREVRDAARQRRDALVAQVAEAVPVQRLPAGNTALTAALCNSVSA